MCGHASTVQLLCRFFRHRWCGLRFIFASALRTVCIPLHPASENWGQATAIAQSLPLRCRSIARLSPRTGPPIRFTTAAAPTITPLFFMACTG